MDKDIYIRVTIGGKYIQRDIHLKKHIRREIINEEMYI